MRDPKALEAWERQVREWERVKERLASASGKPVDALAFERIDEDRRRLELLQSLEFARPLSVRARTPPAQLPVSSRIVTYLPVSRVRWSRARRSVTARSRGT